MHNPMAKLGPTHLDDGACHETIDIDIADETASSGYWFGKIQVHGDLALAQRLVDFLNATQLDLEPMPPTADREPYDEKTYPGYVVGDRDWADANPEAVAWLADNHAKIRAALSTDEDLWRFWAGKAKDLATKLDALRQPTDAMLDAARHLFMWLREPLPTEQSLLRHCERLRIDPPEGCRDVDHHPNKRTQALWIYRAMQGAAP